MVLKCVYRTFRCISSIYIQWRYLYQCSSFLTVGLILMMLHCIFYSILLHVLNFLMCRIRHHMHATCLHHFLFWCIPPNFNLCHMHTILTCTVFPYHWWLVSFQLNLCIIFQYQGLLGLYHKIQNFYFPLFGRGDFFPYPVLVAHYLLIWCFLRLIQMSKDSRFLFWYILSN